MPTSTEFHENDLGVFPKWTNT